jgi:hypothetical protein
MATTYRHDYEAFDAVVLCADWMVANMAERAARVQAECELKAPVDEKSPHSGRYKASFSTSSGIKESAEGKRRAYGRVTNDAPEALFVEYGSEHNERHRTMGNALHAAK